jgi:CheY-like chemotaxis protein
MTRIVDADLLTSSVEMPNDKPRILIVDNNRDFTLSVRLGLERTGRYIVCEENDATRVNQAARSFQPALILLDLAMPAVDGCDVAAGIESDWALHRIPIVFLTGLVTRAEASSGYRIQGHQVVAKPISIPALIAAIEENLPCCAAA